MIDKFVEDAVEVDVDAVSRRENVVIAGVMEHMEEAGIHSGDSSCVTPPLALEDEIVEEIEERDGAHCPCAASARHDERAVRGQGQPDLLLRDQPARLAHRTVREQGHRRAVGQAGDARDAGREDRHGAALAVPGAPDFCRREGPGASRSTSSRASTRFSVRRCDRRAR